MLLDVFDFCSEGLRVELAGPRDAYKAYQDVRAGLAAAAKKQKVEGGPARVEATASGGGTGGSDVEMKDAVDGVVTAPPSTVGSSGGHVGAATGRYELLGVLTHKGRSADSGHYVAWVKQGDGQWIQFDDEKMIPRKEEEVQVGARVCGAPCESSCVAAPALPSCLG